MTPLEKAVSLLGGQTKLAKELGVKQQNVWSWLRIAKKIPAEVCIPIEKATQGQVKKEELRPDIFKQSRHD